MQEAQIKRSERRDNQKTVLGRLQELDRSDVIDHLDQENYEEGHVKIRIIERFSAVERC